MDIVERLRFDAARCEATFSKGVATNIEEAADEIERLRAENVNLRRWKALDKPLTAAMAIANGTTERMRSALRDLLKYCDDHDWGTIPEGATIERARQAAGYEQCVPGGGNDGR